MSPAHHRFLVDQVPPHEHQLFGVTVSDADGPTPNASESSATDDDSGNRRGKSAKAVLLVRPIGVDVGVNW